VEKYFAIIMIIAIIIMGHRQSNQIDHWFVWGQKFFVLLLVG